MALSESKKKDLFKYYSENGFQQPTEIIVRKLGVCHKTFFNRYVNKVKSIEIAWEYWQKQCREKWLDLMQHCNHSVEELTMTMLHIHEMRQDQPHFYEFTRNGRKYLQADSFFYTSVREVLRRGQQCFHIQDDLDVETYTQFLLHNLFLFEMGEDKWPEVLRYILQPALTERGMELFMELPFA